MFVVAYASNLNAQDFNVEKENFFQAKLTTGYPGLLQVDELLDVYQFDRKAVVPLGVSLDYQVLKRFSVGAYFGYEYEAQSGTTINFEGPTHSFVYGFTTDFHLLKRDRFIRFDPYLGMSLFYYSISTSRKVQPAYRVGANIFIKRNLGLNVNVGVGVALAEAGIIYRW